MKELSHIQLQIKETIEELETLKKVHSHLQEIDNQLKSAYSKIKMMDKQLDKELKDIDELERIGVKALFYKTLGSKEEQLEKERQEYLELSLKYKQYKSDIELMEFERDLLKKKSGRLQEVQRKLSNLKKLRQQEILKGTNIQLKDEYQSIVEKLDLNLVIQKELKEAVVTGRQAKSVLEELIGLLNEAGNWGKWDMYGDRNAKYAKKRAMDRAVRILPKARHTLNLFVKEMRDLGENDVNIKLNPIQFNNFTDFFFDNLISDWIVQQKIVSTKNDVGKTHSYIQRLLLTLEQEFKELDRKLALLNSDREAMLLK